MNLEQWKEELAGILPHVIDLRRHLHAHPELSGCETATQKTIMDELKALGYTIRLFENSCGVQADLQNGEGSCIAIRADIDALPIVENNELPFKSVCPGVMHACGHDVHTALALGSAMWFSANRDKWHGTIRFLFENAEETYGGGRQMVADGCLKNPKVDHVIGQHVNPRYTAGTFFAKPGYVSGSSDELFIAVHGKKTHGAYPEGGVDAIVISAQIITALQTLVSRTISPFVPAVVTIGTIEGGTANNIITDEVRMKGTLRTLSRAIHDQLSAAIIRTCRGIAESMGGTCDVDVVPSYGAVYNDDTDYAVIEALAAEIIGADHIVRRESPSLGVDSFCFFVEDTPGVYYDIGSGIGTALHTDTFMVDEDCIAPGIALQIASAMALGLANG